MSASESAALAAVDSARPASFRDAAQTGAKRWWRVAILGGWAAFIIGFTLGEPAANAPRHIWVDGAWTLTYIAATLISALAAARLKGRDRTAWACFAAASGAWLVAQLLWNYFEWAAFNALPAGTPDDIEVPFPAVSDLFYLAFAPLYAIGLMFFGDKPKSAATAPKLVSQLVMIGAAVYAAVGLHVSEALVANADGPLYVATAVAYPLLYDAAFLMGVMSLCLYVWGSKRAVLVLLVIGIGCHATAETLYGLSLLGREYEVGQAYDFLWLLGGAFQFWAAAEHLLRAQAGQQSEAPEEQFLIQAYRRARRLEPMVPALGIVLISLSLGIDADGITRAEAVNILTPACMVFAIAVAVAEGWSWRIEEDLRKVAANAALAARRSENRLSAMLEIAPTAIIAVDHDHAIRLCSKGAATLFGYAASETIGLPLSMLFSDDGNGREAALRDARRDEAVRHGVNRFIGKVAPEPPAASVPLTGADVIRRLRQGDIKGRTQAGTQFPVEGESYDLADGGLTEGGEGALTIIMLSDTTERRRQERALRNAKEAAEAANRAKTQFLANMSHELRTPLNAIIGFSEVISNKLFGELDERYRDYSSDILSSGRHLLGLINDILDLSKIDLGQATLSESEVDLQHAVQTCERLMRERAERGGVRIVTALPPDLPLLWADETKVKQIVLNLLSNAVKFTERGGDVTIGAATLADGGLALSLIDTGIGMRPEDIPKAMTPFGQLESTFERRFEGTGLGLPLVQRLVELHGAELRIDSELGQGTKVEIRFPRRRVVARGSSKEAVKGPAAAPGAGRRKTGTE